jgi:hypothetical protein
MPPSVRQTTHQAPLERHETTHAPQATEVNLIEVPWRMQIGGAIQRAFSLAGLTQKDACRLLDRDQGQIGRWIGGTERPQFDVLFAVKVLRRPLVVALAELAGQGVDVDTVITIRRSA